MGGIAEHQQRLADSVGAKDTSKRSDKMNRLAKLLQENHKFLNGCWQTAYRNIPGLKLLASTTNGTSGIGNWQGRKVYWFANCGGEFKVEPY